MRPMCSRLSGHFTAEVRDERVHFCCKVADEHADDAAQAEGVVDADQDELQRGD